MISKTFLPSSYDVLFCKKQPHLCGVSEIQTTVLALVHLYLRLQLQLPVAPKLPAGVKLNSFPDLRLLQNLREIAVE